MDRGLQCSYKPDQFDITGNKKKIPTKIVCHINQGCSKKKTIINSNKFTIKMAQGRREIF